MYMNIESFLFYQVIKNFLMTPKFKIDAEISSDIAYNKMFIQNRCRDFIYIQADERYNVVRHGVS